MELSCKNQHVRFVKSHGYGACLHKTPADMTVKAGERQSYFTGIETKMTKISPDEFLMKVTSVEKRQFSLRIINKDEEYHQASKQ